MLSEFYGSFYQLVLCSGNQNLFYSSGHKSHQWMPIWTVYVQTVRDTVRCLLLIPVMKQSVCNIVLLDIYCFIISITWPYCRSFDPPVTTLCVYVLSCHNLLCPYLVNVICVLKLSTETYKSSILFYWGLTIWKGNINHLGTEPKFEISIPVILPYCSEERLKKLFS